jgi:hypothetical protein
LKKKKAIMGPFLYYKTMAMMMDENEWRGVGNHESLFLLIADEDNDEKKERRRRRTVPAPATCQLRVRSLYCTPGGYKEMSSIFADQ